MIVVKSGVHKRLERIYRSMLQRCYNPSATAYALYGGRGIKVCNEWKGNPQAFYDWAMKNGFDGSKRGYDNSIDRIDNDQGYSPDNCRFVDAKVQNANRRMPKVAKDGSGRLLVDKDAPIIQRRYTKWKYGRGFLVGNTISQSDAITKLAFYEDLQEQGGLVILD